MDIKDIIDNLTEEDIVSFIENLGAELYNRSNSKELIFTSICHNSDSNKLYYYMESKNFHCWSNCGHIGNILDLLIHINGYEIRDAIQEVKEFFNISNTPTLRRGFRVKKKYKKPTLNEIEVELLPTPEYKPYIYSIFKQTRIKSWENEGITFEALKKFDIRYDDYNEQIVIPHFCWNDDKRVVGIRCRETIKEKEERFGKYHPYYHGKNSYPHSLGKNLYGLNATKNNIKKYKKCIVGEGEKFCLQLESMYPKSNLGVVLCGSSMSMYQKKILIDLGINECLFALDKQYIDIKEMEIWKNKTIKMAQELIENGVECYMLLDELEGVLDYKDSPVDKGKEKFKFLIENKIKIERITNDKL